MQIRPASLPRIYRFATLLAATAALIISGIIINNRLTSQKQESSNTDYFPSNPTPTQAQIFNNKTTPSTEGVFCGGIAGVACPEGYSCKMDGFYPDAGGTCVKTTPKKVESGAGCLISGCNAEICQEDSEEPKNSVCVYKPEYDCYKKTKCEKQSNGKCGWTQSEELTKCMGASI